MLVSIWHWFSVGKGISSFKYLFCRRTKFEIVEYWLLMVSVCLVIAEFNFTFGEINLRMFCLNYQTQSKQGQLLLCTEQCRVVHEHKRQKNFVKIFCLQIIISVGKNCN